MKKITITLLLILFVSSLSAQVGQARILEVKDGQMDKFMSGVAKKTQMYNNSEDSEKFYTFQILTGPNATDFIRVRWMESMNELDNPVDADELSYWNKNARPYYTEGAARIWSRNANLSHVPEESGNTNLRRVIYYNYKDSGEQDFWRFRQRVKKAMVESGYGSAMNVLGCASGCNGNWVQVRFHHDGYAGQSADYGEPLQAMIEKYNELYGNDAYEQDSDKVDATLMPEGRRIRHLMLMPEMSSSW
ncbi:hypothetical protein N9F78_00415 [Flavobacteriaceae bacterium]|jgi:hypothetical protein|nr:hypothetical protein [Flavobacteriaceae bacterium]MDA7741227.1 hypothetical protein [Flavobacteriaceae bacterium]MDA8934770.1 hypothetical protein [Flavobacteriaceae bacterium]MDA9192678.1 hypothetical protein [Flavobacteriaceae bacterium]MDA9818236.1 hypothetical protein [Flavobacteriaceae bacterium]|tara:strand:- start:283 stop:1023 length:741 start_codon:yes stop_codon:yes gene_type:complete